MGVLKKSFRGRSLKGPAIRWLSSIKWEIFDQWKKISFPRRGEERNGAEHEKFFLWFILLTFVLRKEGKMGGPRPRRNLWQRRKRNLHPEEKAEEEMSKQSWEQNTSRKEEKTLW